MEPSDRRFEKGFFTRVHLAIATKYPSLATRRGLFVVGTMAGTLIAVLFLAEALIGRGSVAVGPMSESHALLARGCSGCHTPVLGARDQNCLACHEASGNKGAPYTLARHYRYNSDETDRSAPKRLEPQCADCHREHRGRLTSLTAVSDDQCTSCHKVGSFRRGHPEFEFARKSLADPANLKFTHIYHVKKVMEDRKLDNPEQACLTCHEAQPDGRLYKPISYARACESCHLPGSGKRMPFVPLHGNGRPGVMTLAEIKRSGAPGTQWADYWNPADFTEGGGGVRKTNVFHADPWVMHNLKLLRRELYPRAELAELLNATAELDPGDAKPVYADAIAMLESQITSLRANPSPDVQKEVEDLSALLRQVRARIDAPGAPLDVSRFAVSAGDKASGANEAAYNAVIDSLTRPCQECHFVERGMIKRVQTDQRALVRADFNHRKHVSLSGCINCHTAIPFKEYLESGKKAPPEVDRAEILNIPTIQTCRECHSGSSAPDRCSACHRFHPDRSHWSNLLR